MCSQGRFRCRIAVFALYRSCHIRKLTFRHDLPENIQMQNCCFALYRSYHIRKLTFRHDLPEKIQMQNCCICVIYELPHQKTYLQTCVPREDSDAELLYLRYIGAATSENLPSDMFPGKIQMQNCCICVIYELPHQKTYLQTYVPREDSDAELLYLCYI